MVKMLGREEKGQVDETKVGWDGRNWVVEFSSIKKPVEFRADGRWDHWNATWETREKLDHLQHKVVR